jgi:hypothetical protein
VSKKQAFSLLTISLIVSAIEIQPVSANTRWQKFKQFQQQKVQPFLDKHQIKFNATYTPPRLPVSIRCDTHGNTTVSINPSLPTPLGRFGIGATRQIQRKCGLK